MDHGQEKDVSPAAVARMVEAFERAGLSPKQTILNGFGEAYPALSTMVAKAATERGNAALSAEAMLAQADVVATCFVGSPDRLFALLRSGYGNVLTHALVSAGAVFPIVHTLAAQHGVALCDVMSDPSFGPYAMRHGRDEAYVLLDDVAPTILQAGGDAPVPHGMVGEVVVCDRLGQDPAIRTGVLSAFEQVPHRYRAPGLMGWMGYAQPRLEVQSQEVRAVDLATLISEHDEVLDARLLAFAKDEAEPVLQLETEAGDWIESDVLASFEALTGLRPQVHRVPPGQFNNTGRPFALRAA